MIPRTFHRVWVGPKKMPVEFEGYWEQFRLLHPGWELQTWRDPIEEKDYELGRFFASCQHPAQMADLLRIELLWRHGGIYVDTDTEPLRPFDSLLEHRCFAGRTHLSVETAVIGSEPGHPALRAIMDALVAREQLPDDQPINAATGPVFVHPFLVDRDDVTILDQAVFYPWYWDEAADRSRITSSTLAVQHWSGSWVPKPPLSARIRDRVPWRPPLLGRLQNRRRQ